jgi:hypothetical protein
MKLTQVALEINAQIAIGFVPPSEINVIGRVECGLDEP